VRWMLLRQVFWAIKRCWNRWWWSKHGFVWAFRGWERYLFFFWSCFQFSVFISVSIFMAWLVNCYVFIYLIFFNSFLHFIRTLNCILFLTWKSLWSGAWALFLNKTIMNTNFIKFTVWLKVYIIYRLFIQIFNKIEKLFDICYWDL
jgi:hypothetical protein